LETLGNVVRFAGLVVTVVACNFLAAERGVVSGVVAAIGFRAGVAFGGTWPPDGRDVMSILLVAKTSEFPTPASSWNRRASRRIDSCRRTLLRTRRYLHARWAAAQRAAGSEACTPAHAGAKFDIRTGALQCAPATAAHQVKVEGDQILVRLDDYPFCLK
jgi:hypothetical protein